MERFIIFVKDYFFSKSVVDFKKTEMTEKQWAQMRSDPAVTFWHDPYPSKSEYLISKDGDNWHLYRFADKWGQVGRCTWTLDGKPQYGPFVVGFVNIDDIKRL